MRGFGTLAGALMMTLAMVGCGGSDETHPADGKPFVKWGKPAGETPTGVVILLHGGGWQPNPRAYPGELTLASTLQGLGYATVVVGYGEGAEGFREIEQVYSQAQRRYPDLPICVHGISAGGNLGLMLASREPDLTCVADIAGPADLTSLKEQGGTEAHDLAVEAFGEDQLCRWSPIKYADRIKAKVLMVLAQTDPIVPVAQGREFTRARPETQLFVVPAGSTPDPVLHNATVTPAGAQAANQLTISFLAQAMQGG